MSTIGGEGRGALAIFLSNIEMVMADERLSFRIVQYDTTSFSAPEVVELFGNDGVKFFSIDAGHTIPHACNDLSLAQEVLVPAGKEVEIAGSECLSFA
jgi:hypothetical protein